MRVSISTFSWSSSSRRFFLSRDILTDLEFSSAEEASDDTDNTVLPGDDDCDDPLDALEEFEEVVDTEETAEEDEDDADDDAYPFFFFLFPLDLDFLPPLLVGAGSRPPADCTSLALHVLSELTSVPKSWAFVSDLVGGRGRGGVVGVGSGGGGSGVLDDVDVLLLLVAPVVFFEFGALLTVFFREPGFVLLVDPIVPTKSMGGRGKLMGMLS